MIGAAFAAAAPGVPSWSTGYQNGNDMGGLIAAVLAPAGGFGKFLLVFIALSTSSACAPSMYSFGEYSLIRRCDRFHQNHPSNFFIFLFFYFNHRFRYVEHPILFFRVRQLFYGYSPLLRSSASICLCRRVHSHVSE